MHIYLNRIKIVTIFKNFLSNHYQVFDSRKEPEPEPQFVIAAQACGGNLPWLSAPPPQHWLSVSTFISGSHGRSMTLFSHLQVHELDRAWCLTEGATLVECSRDLA
jgi:hypothetical protein